MVKIFRVFSFHHFTPYTKSLNGKLQYIIRKLGVERLSMWQVYRRQYKELAIAKWLLFC